MQESSMDAKIREQKHHEKQDIYIVSNCKREMLCLLKEKTDKHHLNQMIKVNIISNQDIWTSCAS